MKFIIKVDKILSYQAGIYKNGYKTFTKTKFKQYQKEIKYQLPSKYDFDKNSISIDILMIFKLPKTISKKEKEKRIKGVFATNNIDLDNASKGIIDVIAEKYNFNDKNIYNLNITKIWNQYEDIRQDIIKIDIK